jgi:hypothetical protein
VRAASLLNFIIKQGWQIWHVYASVNGGRSVCKRGVAAAGGAGHAGESCCAALAVLLASMSNHTCTLIIALAVLMKG